MDVVTLFYTGKSMQIASQRDRAATCNPTEKSIVFKYHDVKTQAINLTHPVHQPEKLQLNERCSDLVQSEGMPSYISRLSHRISKRMSFRRFGSFGS